MGALTAERVRPATRGGTQINHFALLQAGAALTSGSDCTGKTRLATRLRSSARDFERVRVGDVAGFAAKIIQNILH